ncbi:phage tail family protein [Priestia taiwanensis]|uniref:Siphovirus-type tail component C-terminal domain-containing protein n=1 Tax=Priestia taiwanensis TaxID=1347902 RepID=A0A917AK66_9BACI|nr:phage tail family protein [Priestia taiwanensis]MBM7362000.1 hypothetical protein [Priestia taiwanensis]GGE58650.1 hypothetical protein GCM10007140_06250 [Priestia taiwanensis]
MIIQGLKITNAKGESIEFNNHFRLNDDFDLNALGATVNYTDSTEDGSNYQNTKLENRDFDVPFFIHKTVSEAWWIEEQRNLAHKVFNPKSNPMRLDLVTPAGEKYYMNANLEGTPVFPKGEENSNEIWQDGLLQFSANDPYIYSQTETKVDIAVWNSSFEFPLETPVTGIEFGYRSPSLIVNVLNEGQDSTGMMIRFKATGTLKNPNLINVNTYESLKINTTMLSGDVIEVSTYKRKKSVKLIRNNIETNIFNRLDLESKFLQLETGDNLFRYNADTGIDNLEVSMNFTPRMLGV